MQRELRSRKSPLMERVERICKRENFKEKEETFPTFNRLSSLEMFQDEPVVQQSFTRLKFNKRKEK
jgi:hypothetical protein